MKLKDVKNKTFPPVFRLGCVLLCLACIQSSFCYKQQSQQKPLELMSSQLRKSFDKIEGHIPRDNWKRHLSRRSYSAPVIVVPPQSTVVREGDTLILHCKATGNPQPVIKWKKVGSSLPLGRHSVHNVGVNVVLLMINSMKISDQGKYQCTAENTAQGQATAVATITVQGKPAHISAKINKTTESIITTEGENVTFTCEATGLPVPTVTWSKALSTINSSIVRSHRIKSRSGKQEIILSSITLTDVTAKDSGLYVCTAENQLNNDTRWVQLMVVRSQVFKFATKPPSEYRVIEGQQVVLPCQVTKADSILWTSSKSLVGRAVQYGNGSLVITRVTPKDHGVYTCQASRNAFGLTQTITASTHLLVIESSHGLEHSTILSYYPVKYRQVLTAYLGPVVQKSSRWARCWHASNDGWDVRKKFHAQCDNKGPTVTIVKYRDYVFGGYTDTSWKMRGDYAGESTFKSFLFSLSNIHGFHPVKMILRGYDNSEAIYDSKFSGPRFGGGPDMKLVKKSGSWSPDSYMHPQHYYAPPGCEIDKICTFYTGRKTFMPHDIEVFYEVTN